MVRVVSQALKKADGNNAKVEDVLDFKVIELIEMQEKSLFHTSEHTRSMLSLQRVLDHLENRTQTI